jgi:hypothetical protein
MTASTASHLRLLVPCPVKEGIAEGSILIAEAVAVESLVKGMADDGEG